MKINGDTLISWGFKPTGKWFGEAIKAADKMARDAHFKKASYTEDDYKEAVKALQPIEPEKVPMQSGVDVPQYYNIETSTEYEKDNLLKVKQHMDFITKIPVIKAVSVMPDACPSGSQLGTIPVGGVAYTEDAIIPGFHSADICCSVAISVLDSGNAKDVLDLAMKVTHFGKGGRPRSNDIQVSQDLLNAFEANPYLSNKGGVADKHFGTQGDGNHFFYVGRLESSGQLCIVTHHGSRKPGAMLYEVGTHVAHEYTKKICPEIDKHNAWIKFDTQEGQDYWSALQLVRDWTKKNHFAIHDSIIKQLKLKVKDRYWNEHNFVFKRTYNGKEYFAHAKGATPNYIGFASDSFGKTLIPLNMANPILICETNKNPDFGLDFHSEKSLGFCPHGAGRNFSRTEFTKRLTESGRSGKDVIAETLAKVDARAFSGKHDLSEFPEAYKNADKIISEINKFDLTKIVDKVLPEGCIMAGHDGIDYKEIKRRKKERAEKLKEGF